MLLIGLLVLLLGWLPRWLLAERHVVVALGQDGIALGADAAVVPIRAGEQLIPGTRVLSGGPDSLRLAAEQRAWLAAGRVPQPAELSSSTMTADALLDLHLLMADQSAPIAAISPAWRYLWPRDSALVAVAFARTGHLTEAEKIVDQLQRIQAPDGTFQARYLPGSVQPPDARGVQLDGTGWALWALNQVVAQTPTRQRIPLIERHRGLLDRSVAMITRTLPATADGRLPVSSDYREVAETKPTLATSAVLLAGLVAGADLYRRIADPRSTAITAQAASFRAVLLDDFGPGFPRHQGGSAGSADLGVALLLPPFSPIAEPATVSGWRHSISTTTEPAGGLGMAGSWKFAGISWTPTTATEAMTAAALDDRPAALTWLRWLDAHRTDQGSIPEKVLWDGRPASVAPLGWSAAATLIAADQLVRG